MAHYLRYIHNGLCHLLEEHQLCGQILDTVNLYLASKGIRIATGNRAESIRKLVKKLGSVEQLKACYEAGPTGYVLYWQLAELGVACEVIAPTLVPMKAGDRVKTDRRDAERLARSYRSLQR